ncbi:probable low affinity copper uptake protein 2 [Ischnura elegans]|uniref:probable low affinity copper uptake protein 2 n=1 Tax=Ischnura elegans TaxID=197161 RepID=UPI001ED874B4|nr:probable low affinity copper uptake protein 2 [Ischnura elegans]
MEQSFWIGTRIKNFLIEGYDITSVWGLLATCIGASSLAVLYEGGRMYKLYCKSHVYTTTQEVSDSNADTATLMTSTSETAGNRRSTFERLCHAAKYGVVCMQNELIGYLLMLSVMRYNIAIALAVWLGAGIGYFIFAANISSTLSAGTNKKGCGGRSGSLSPPQECDSATDKLTEVNVGNEEEGIWTTETSQLPLSNEEDRGLRDVYDHVIGHDQNQGSVLTATAIVHREPSV